jgi:hypothetical protein
MRAPLFQRFRTALDGPSGQLLRGLLLLDLTTEQIFAAYHGAQVDPLDEIAIVAALDRIEGVEPPSAETDSRAGADLAEAIIKQALNDLSDPDPDVRADARWFLTEGLFEPDRTFPPAGKIDRESFRAGVEELALRGEESATRRRARRTEQPLAEILAAIQAGAAPAAVAKQFKVSAKCVLRAQIADAYSRGESSIAVGERFGIYATTVQRIARQFGIPVRSVGCARKS